MNAQYALAKAAGVTSTRIYTTVGASNLTNCLTASCAYGGAVKALYQARAYNFTGEWLSGGTVVCCNCAADARAPAAQSRWASSCRRWRRR